MSLRNETGKLGEFWATATTHASKRRNGVLRRGNEAGLGESLHVTGTP